MTLGFAAESTLPIAGASILVVFIIHPVPTHGENRTPAGSCMTVLSAVEGQSLKEDSFLLGSVPN